MGYTEKLDVLDFIINVLVEHEKALDSLISRLENTPIRLNTWKTIHQHGGKMPSINKNVSVFISAEEFVNKLFDIDDLYTTVDGSLRKLQKYYLKEASLFKDIIEKYKEKGEYEKRPDLEKYYLDCLKHSSRTALGARLAIERLEEIVYPSMTEYHRARGFKGKLAWEAEEEG